MQSGSAVEELTIIFGELERCHRAADNHGVVSTLGFARNDLKEFARGVQPLADAPTRAAALGVLGGLTRAYIGLLETSEGVEDCVPRGEASPEPEAGDSVQEKDKPKEGEKKKEKQQQTEEGSGG